jgi:hypothetical protein
MRCIGNQNRKAHYRHIASCDDLLGKAIPSLDRDIALASNCQVNKTLCVMLTKSKVEDEKHLHFRNWLSRDHLCLLGLSISIAFTAWKRRIRKLEGYGRMLHGMLIVQRDIPRRYVGTQTAAPLQAKLRGGSESLPCQQGCKAKELE